MLNAQHVRYPISRGNTVCSALSPKPSTTSKPYRVLPDDLLPSERPPLPPRNRTVPFIGLVSEVLLGGAPIIRQAVEKHGSIVNSNHMIGEKLNVCEYYAISAILKDTDVFRNTNALEGMENLLPGNLLSLDGPDHAAARQLLAPAFSPALFPYYSSLISRRAQSTWAKVAKRVSSGKVKLDSVFREHYLGIVIEITTGLRKRSA